MSPLSRRVQSVQEHHQGQRQRKRAEGKVTGSYRQGSAYTDHVFKFRMLFFSLRSPPPQTNPPLHRRRPLLIFK